MVLTVSSACLGNARLPEGVTMTTDEINAAYGDQLGGCTIAGGGAIHTLVASAWHGWTGDTIVVPDGMTVSLLDEDVDAAMAATSISSASAMASSTLPWSAPAKAACMPQTTFPPALKSSSWKRSLASSPCKSMTYPMIS